MCTKKGEAEKCYMGRKKNKHLYKVDMGGSTIAGDESKLQSESRVPSLSAPQCIYVFPQRSTDTHKT